MSTEDQDRRGRATHETDTAPETAAAGQPYAKLAEIYDRIMRPVGYEMWADYVEKLCARYGHQPRRLLDLACGTGSTSLPFARRGYEVVGVDSSPAMLAVARAKAAAAGHKIDFIQGDMRDFSLPAPVDLAICLFDSINYLLTPADVARACAAVYRALAPGGLFVCDANTRHRLSRIEDEEMVFTEDDYCLVWRNSYDREREIWRADLTGFLRRGELFERFVEAHEERAYGPRELADAVAAGGLELVAMHAAFGFEPVAEGTDRVYVVARRPDEAAAHRPADDAARQHASDRKGEPA